ncbi:hypothetical protein PIB30_082619, partial [Stylosanthes scabra]|nr:hypothetical protein [Stylosanthes scabra]
PLFSSFPAPFPTSKSDTSYTKAFVSSLRFQRNQPCINRTLDAPSSSSRSRCVHQLQTSNPVCSVTVGSSAIDAPDCATSSILVASSDISATVGFQFEINGPDQSPH